MGRLFASWLCLTLGTVSLVLGGASFVVERNLFNSAVFGLRAAESLRDPRVAAYVSDQITDQVIRARPDLIAFRPLIQSAARATVSSRAFQTLMVPAARQFHQALLSNETHRIVLALPDLQILVNSSLKEASPELAGKIPPQVEGALSKLSAGRNGQYLLQLSHIGRNLRWLWRALLPTAVLLFVLSLVLARQRQRGLFHIGVGILVAALLTGLVLPVGALFCRLIHTDLDRGLALGLWWTYLGDLGRWSLLFASVGVVVTAGATSRLEAWNPVALARRSGHFLTHVPDNSRRRLIWASLLVVLGLFVVLFPRLTIVWAVALAGGLAIFVGTRELFRLFLEQWGPEHKTVANSVQTGQRHGPLSAGFALGGLCLLLGGAAWYFFFHDSSAVVHVEASNPEICNGYAELCDKHLDEVAFAGTHNSMSNQDMPSWLFPQQEASIPRQLADGIRALLIDVHYGFPGAARVKTDLSGEPNAEKIKAVVGDEGFEAAMRVRNNLVGVDSGRRRLYLCHGFCELGSYDLINALHEIRAFLSTHPDEVLILDIEDYVTPQDLAAAFDASRLSDFVYKGPTGPPWPTLREAISSGQRVFVLIESGLQGVSWLRPSYPTMRETPYSFHHPDEFSCEANRGGNTGSLFLMNHWIETTPTPKPSNAAIVNAYPFLLKRVEQCEAERRHMVNIVAVDFYRTGDLLRVVNHVNGVGESVVAAEDTGGAQ